MVIHSYLINTELYLNLKKYGDKLLVVKSLAKYLMVYKSIWISHKSIEDCIEVYKIRQTQILILVILFLVEKMVKKGITGMKV